MFFSGISSLKHHLGNMFGLCFQPIIFRCRFIGDFTYNSMCNDSVGAKSWWLFGSSEFCVAKTSTLKKGRKIGVKTIGGCMIWALQKLGGGFRYFFIFIPIWGRWTHFDSYFSKGLKPRNQENLWLFSIYVGDVIFPPSYIFGDHFINHDWIGSRH